MNQVEEKVPTAHEYLRFLAAMISARLKVAKLQSKASEFHAGFEELVSNDEANCNNVLYGFVAVLLEYVLPYASKETAEIIRQEIDSCRAADINLFNTFLALAKAQSRTEFRALEALILAGRQYMTPYSPQAKAWAQQDAKAVARVEATYWATGVAASIARRDLWEAMVAVSRVKQAAYLFEEAWAEAWTEDQAKDVAALASADTYVWMLENLLKLLKEQAG